MSNIQTIQTINILSSESNTEKSSTFQKYSSIFRDEIRNKLLNTPLYVCLRYFKFTHTFPNLWEGEQLVIGVNVGAIDASTTYTTYIYTFTCPKTGYYLPTDFTDDNATSSITTFQFRQRNTTTAPTVIDTYQTVYSTIYPTYPAESATPPLREITSGGQVGIKHSAAGTINQMPIQPLLGFHSPSQKFYFYLPQITTSDSAVVADYFKTYPCMNIVCPRADGMEKYSWIIPKQICIFMKNSAKRLLQFFGFYRENTSTIYNSSLYSYETSALSSYKIDTSDLFGVLRQNVSIEVLGPYSSSTYGNGATYTCADNSTKGNYRISSGYSDTEHGYVSEQALFAPYMVCTDPISDLIVECEQVREGNLESDENFQATKTICSMPIISTYGQKQSYLPLHENWVPLTSEGLNRIDLIISSSFTNSIDFQGIPWDVELAIGTLIPTIVDPMNGASLQHQQTGTMFTKFESQKRQRWM